jgi:t-SNARE complex subunit (syntaxin)
MVDRDRARDVARAAAWPFWVCWWLPQVLFVVAMVVTFAVAPPWR